MLTEDEKPEKDLSRRGKSVHSEAEEVNAN